MRDRHLDLPLTEAELAQVRDAAKASGLAMAAWARTTLLREAKAPR